MIDTALPSLQAWTDAMMRVEIPVLPGSVAELSQLRLVEETKGTVDAHTLAGGLGNDPLMTLKVLVHVSRYCTRLNVEPPETLTGAIVMQGIGPFFKTLTVSEPALRFASAWLERSARGRKRARVDGRRTAATGPSTPSASVPPASPRVRSSTSATPPRSAGGTAAPPSAPGRPSAACPRRRRRRARAEVRHRHQQSRQCGNPCGNLLSEGLSEGTIVCGRSDNAL